MPDASPRAMLPPSGCGEARGEMRNTRRWPGLVRVALILAAAGLAAPGLPEVCPAGAEPGGEPGPANPTAPPDLAEIGAGPRQFMTPHSVIVDLERRLLVCDRENDRVQVFTRDGLWLADWKSLCRPMDLCQREDGVVLVTDQVPSVTAFAPDGARIDRARPSLNGAHGIALGRTGEIYLAEIEPSSVTKLIPA